MKILITNTGPWGTGSFTVAKAIMQELRLLGHEVKIFFPDDGLPSHDLEEYYAFPNVFDIWKFPIEREGVSLPSFPLIIPDPHPRNAMGRTLLELEDSQYQLYLSEFERQIKRVIREFQPDVIECQHIWAFDSVIKKLGYPYICVAHHSDQLGFQYDKRMQPVAIESAQHAEYIFAISDFVKEEVLSLYGVEEEKVVFLPNGYDRHTFKPFPCERKEVFEQLGVEIPEDAYVVSFAGKVSRTKGVDILLQANKLLKAKDKVHFIMLGAGDIDVLLSEKEKAKSSFERVHFVGHQSAQTLAKVHNIADISVLPSRSEGFGIACLEAMACGLPMIVTKTGGLGEYAVGEMIESGSPTQLAKAIQKFVQLDSQAYTRLSNEAIRVANRFSWASIAEERLIYYERLYHL